MKIIESSEQISKTPELNTQIQDDPKEQLALLMERIKADWLFQQWEAYIAKWKIKDAIDTFNELIKKYEYSDKYRISKFKLWELYIKTEDYDKAELLLREFIMISKWNVEINYLNAMFTLAEALYSQYKYDISWTIPKMIEARNLYKILAQINTSKEIAEKSLKRITECEELLAENDFLAVKVYERGDKYKNALHRLKLMRVDFEWNKKIIDRIDTLSARIWELYKKQSAEKWEKQIKMLETRLERSKRKKAKMEDSLPDIESRLSKLSWDDNKKLSKKIKEIKDQIAYLWRSIVLDEDRIKEVKTHWFNPDLEPGMPDPDVVSLTIPWTDIEIIF